MAQVSQQAAVKDAPRLGIMDRIDIIKNKRSFPLVFPLPRASFSFPTPPCPDELSGRIRCSCSDFCAHPLSQKKRDLASPGDALTCEFIGNG